jgi:HAD superfamily hydrolase (TIGR01509 family)
VVFDCDGTLADTEPLSDLAWRETLAHFGYRATDEDFRAVVGHPYAHTFAYFARRAPIGDPDEFRPLVRERFQRLVDQRLRLHADAESTLRELAGRGVPLAIASSSRRAHVLQIIERFDIGHLVGAVVGADDVDRHKPDPEPYLVAAAALGADPRRCAAVEDTPVGVDSAVAAGMFTVAVLRGGFARTHLAAAHRVVDSVTVSSLSP